MLDIYIWSVVLSFIFSIIGEIKIRLYLKSIKRKPKKYELRYQIPEYTTSILKKFIPIHNVIYIMGGILVLICFDSLVYKGNIYEEMIRRSEPIE